MTSGPSSRRSRRTSVCSVLRAERGGCSPHNTSMRVSTEDVRSPNAASTDSARRSIRRRISIVPSPLTSRTVPRTLTSTARPYCQARDATGTVKPRPTLEMGGPGDADRCTQPNDRCAGRDGDHARPVGDDVGAVGVDLDIRSQPVTTGTTRPSCRVAAAIAAPRPQCRAGRRRDVAPDDVDETSEHG